MSALPKETGRPVTCGSVESIDGGTLSSVHVARLTRIADAEIPGTRRHAHLLAAIECIQTLTRKNRRLGAQVGGTARRKLVSHRGLMLSGKPEAIAEDIAELANDGKVTAYRLKRAVRLMKGGEVPGAGRLIGTYDDRADYRAIVEDIKEALGV